ncbi:unnamed protein product [Paramecium primaurelia]|uniref:RING-type domain-containing protein n=1 Tax=Paramecium primaurelia TaxID=5886 RepID=A0A8S1NJV7_PARPR|nr:unnamed protein product [Paramecium primaurelia]
MQNSSKKQESHDCNDCWSALLCGLVEILIKTKNQDQIKLLIPLANQFAPIRIHKTIELLNQMIRNPNITLFYALVNQEESSQIIKMHIFAQYKIIAPSICNKDILQKLGQTFKIDMIFLTYNTSISLSNSENLPLILKIVQFQSHYTVETQEKQRSRSNSLQHDFILEMKQECNGCLRSFDQIELNKSIACSHTYCKQCLKLYFKLGSYFICRDFYCKIELSKDDFPFLQLSPLMDPYSQVNKCLQCKLSSEKLYTNKCGHTHCEKCIKDSLNKSKYFQTHFCLEPSCTEILNNELIRNNNSKEIDVNQLLQKSNSIKQKASDFCDFCKKTQEQGVKNKCGHYYCKSCLQSQYQSIITYGLNKIVECPQCNSKFNIDTTLEEYYIQLQQLSTPRLNKMRSISQQQPDLQPSPSLGLILNPQDQGIRLKTNEDQQQQNSQLKRQNSIDLKSIYNGGSTPRRIIPQISTSSRNNYPQTQQSLQFHRSPQFF